MFLFPNCLEIFTFVYDQSFFSQPHAQLDHFYRLDWLHVLYAIDDPFSRATRVECVFRAQEQP